MPDRIHRPSKSRFGEFEVDRPACALYRNGQRVPLQIQPFRVLEALVDSAGEVVTRETLYARIWPGKVYIDVDRGLNNAVNRLRQALGDSGDTPVFIETLPRIGYRFIHPLEPDTEPVSPPAAPVQDAAPAPAPAGKGRQRPQRPYLVVASAFAASTVAVAALWWTAQQAQDGSDSGSERGPTTQAQAQAQAQEAYLRGLRHFEQRNKDSQRLAIEQFRRATELDPTFAKAFARLAMAYASAGGNTHARFLSSEEALAPALAAAERALQLDPDLGQAHIALARVLNSLQPWSKPTDLAIEQAFRRGLELDPADAESYLQFGNFFAKRGRSDEAIALYRKALALEPLSANVSSRLGQELVGTGRTDEGLELLRRTVELEPFQYNARLRLGWAYVTVGDLDAAEREFSVADGISPGSAAALSSLAFVAGRKGDEQRARDLLGKLRSAPDSASDPFVLAITYVGLGQREESLAWLEKTVQQTRILHGHPFWGLQAPIYDWLRDDVRFRRLEQQVAASAPSDPSGETMP
jgi:DNA-binding winged helix-turn-helix (wHTH) protein/Tfp pilus assembly protein PilF